jgi:hypothetical protein
MLHLLTSLLFTGIIAPSTPKLHQILLLDEHYQCLSVQDEQFILHSLCSRSLTSSFTSKVVCSCPVTHYAILSSLQFLQIIQLSDY